MRARASRLADKLILGAWVTTNVSQRISRPLVHLPVPVTFNLSQLAAPLMSDHSILWCCFIGLARRSSTMTSLHRHGAKEAYKQIHLRMKKSGLTTIKVAV